MFMMLFSCYIGFKMNADNFMDVLSTGVDVCNLARGIHQQAKEANIVKPELTGVSISNHA